MSAKAAEAVEAVTAEEAKLDAHELRADFPIFQQRMHGKPLALWGAKTRVGRGTEPLCRGTLVSALLAPSAFCVC